VRERRDTKGEQKIGNTVDSKKLDEIKHKSYAHIVPEMIVKEMQKMRTFSKLWIIITFFII
jgi:hypothetical protein